MSQDALDRVMTHCREGVLLREKFFQDHAQDVVDVARTMAVCLARGGKILFCGNGGSAADAQHLAAEFVGRFQLERPPLPAIALTTDTSVLTAIGNDYGFDQVFSKQVQALGERGDILVGISTSGNSPNVLRAFRVGRDKGLVCVSMGGKGGGEMAPMAAHNLLVPGKVTALIQEVHIAIGHMLCNLVDFFLFEAVTELQPYLEEA